MSFSFVVIWLWFSLVWGSVACKAGIKIGRRNINNLRYADDTTLMAESEEELKSLLRVKEGSERAGLKLNIKKKNKIMASGPTTSWQIEGEKVEVVTDFLFLGSKITTDGYCSHEIRRHLLLGRKVMTNIVCWKAKPLLCWQRSLLSRPWSSQWPCTTHVQLWELDCKEGIALKNWCLWTMVLEKTPESPLDSKEIKPVNLKGN